MPIVDGGRVKRRSLRAFTLMELLIVVIVIGIIVALSVPSYINTREKAIDKEAITALKLIRGANKQYYVKGNVFYPISGTVNSLPIINSNLSTDITTTNWAISITGTGAAYTATAVRSGRTWTINQGTADPACTPATACL